MRSATIKATYSLDPLTTNEIEVLAQEWGISKSEVIRRSVHSAMARKDELSAQRTLSRREALDALQKMPRLNKQQVSAWQREIRDERAAR